MGRRKRNVVVTSVSIPIPLKDRMDAVGNEVNWSQVACQAFEQELKRISEQRNGRSVEDSSQMFFVGMNANGVIREVQGLQ